MSEVHRYQVVTMLSASGATIGYDPHGPDVVMASAFDEATRLFLDAAERCVAAERRENELQQRLTAADEALVKAADEFILLGLEAGQRLDVLEGLLRNASAWIKRNSCHGTDAIELWERIDAALKPAECNDSCEFCKGWGFRSNPDGADEGCGACNGTGKEPSDDQP